MTERYAFPSPPFSENARAKIAPAPRNGRESRRSRSPTCAASEAGAERAAAANGS